MIYRLLLRTRLVQWIKPAARYPADPRAVFILAVSVFGGGTALLIDAAPESLEALIPTWAVFVWGITLTLGSLVTLMGMKFQTLEGILTEQVGSVTVGAVTCFYSAVAFYSLGWNAIQIVGIVLAWGLACFIRWLQLQLLLVDYQGQAEHNQADRAANLREGL